MKIKNLIIRILSFYIIIISVSCSEEEMPTREYPILETLEVTNISETGVTFNAKIINSNNLDIIEYGFVWIYNRQNKEPTLESNRIFLTENIKEGDFSANITTTLSKNSFYNVKAFVKTEEYTVYGKNIEFRSLGSGAATIYDFYPKAGVEGDTINIKGKNFSYLKVENRVLFPKGIGSPIISCTDSTIKCKVPKGVSGEPYPIKVTVIGKTTSSDSLFTLLVPWLKREDIPTDGATRYSATGFSLLNKGYVGLGFTDGIYNNDFHKYDPNLNTWEKITDFSGEKRAYATSFVIENYAYVGTGRISFSHSENKNDFWRFDPQSETWTEIASLPVSSGSAIGFSVNDKGYIFTPDNTPNFWSYNPSNDEWIQMPDLLPNTLGGIGRGVTGFVVENKIYIYAQMEELYEFDTNTLQWSRRNDVIYSGELIYDSGFSIKNKGYLIGEYYVLEYNSLSDSWKELSQFPGGFRYRGVVFVLDNNAYFGSGVGYSDFWKFNPEYE